MAVKFKAKRRSDYKAPEFTALTVELTFELADDDTKVTAITRYKRLCTDKKIPLVLDGEELELKSVSLDGGSCKFLERDGKLIVEDVPDEFELTVENVISPITNSELMGLYKSGGIFCTQCEPEGFRRITYFLDRPDVLARYKVTIISPEYGYGVLLSNGNLIEKGVRKGRRYAVWDDPFPKPSYLFALVAGTFDIVSDTYVTGSGRHVDLSLYVDRGSYERGLWAMQSIKDAMKWDEQRFGLEYDLNNFKVVAVDFFNQGAMENKSLNIFNSIYVMVDPQTASDMDFYDVQSVIGHEYFHNYTGDRVTLRDWFQLSLKESLTVFRDQEFSSDLASRTLTRLNAVEVIRGAQFDEDASPLAHPVRPDEVMEMNNFYTVTIYDKGAEIIRMIHTIIGEEKFRAGLSLYLKRYDGQAVTIEDFLLAMEEASGADLKQFRLWYTQAGTPKLKASWEYDAGSSKLRLKLEQSVPPTRGQSQKSPMYIPVRVDFIDGSGQVLKAPELEDRSFIILKDAVQSYDFTMPEDALPVLLKDFSAPVKLEAPYEIKDYARMLEFSDDAFICANAAVELQHDYVRAFITHADKADPSSYITALHEIMNKATLESDCVLLSKLLEIESLTAMMQIDEKINLDGLIGARRSLLNQTALILNKDFRRLYETIRASSARYSVGDLGRRAVNNQALFMLAAGLKAKGEEAQASDLCLKHYHEGRNMTERLGAMKVAVHLELPCAQSILELFEKRFGNDPLVMDNYFRIQATVSSEETVFSVRRLLKHPCFDMTNPNRVRALVGAMARNNPEALHRIDGAGYHLLSMLIAKFDENNGMLASALVGPLLSFRRFDPSRATLMRTELERLARQPKLSRGLYEKIEAALKNGA